MAGASEPIDTTAEVGEQVVDAAGVSVSSDTVTKVNAAGVSLPSDNFTNDSAMMIAWERFLESKRPDALFVDPLAEVLAGTKGEALSQNFGTYSKMFSFEDWVEFHKMWVAVRTRFIDDRVEEFSGSCAQLVNLGAGMDTRPYRMECYKSFANGCFDVDMEAVNSNKKELFQRVLQSPPPHCCVTRVDLDFLDEQKTLATELCKEESPFDAAAPTLFLAEGLIMYLGLVGKFKLLADVSKVAAPGSVFVLQYADASGSEMARSMPSFLDNFLSEEEVSRELTKHGWTDIEINNFGDEKLSFGRFPTERFKPSAQFSFCVCRKGAAS